MSIHYFRNTVYKHDKIQKNLTKREIEVIHDIVSEYSNSITNRIGFRRRLEMLVVNAKTSLKAKIKCKISETK